MSNLIKIVKPKLGKCLIEKEITIDDSRGDIYDLWIKNCNLDFKIEEIEFNGCKFNNVDFSTNKVRDIDFIDCIFDSCNLCGIDFSNRSIHRCSFICCNLTGCAFIQSGIQDVSIIDSKCDYTNFSNSKIKHFMIKTSVFRESKVVGVDWNDVMFNDVDFSKTEFLHTKLKKIDFSNCNIQDIGVIANDVCGMIVSPEQALMLVSLLGIVIKD